MSGHAHHDQRIARALGQPLSRHLVERGAERHTNAEFIGPSGDALKKPRSRGRPRRAPARGPRKIPNRLATSRRFFGRELRRSLRKAAKRVVPKVEHHAGELFPSIASSGPTSRSRIARSCGSRRSWRRPADERWRLRDHRGEGSAQRGGRVRKSVGGVHRVPRFGHWTDLATRDPRDKKRFREARSGRDRIGPIPRQIGNLG
jgi:hypothetical protein